MIPLSEIVHGSYYFNPLALPNFLAGFGLWALGIWEFVTGRGSLASRYLFLFTSCIGFYFLTFGMAYCSLDQAAATAWIRSAYVSVPLIPVAVFCIIDNFLGGKPGLSPWRVAAVAPAVFFVAVNIFSTALIAGTQRMWWGNTKLYGPLGLLFFAYFAITVGVSIARVIRRRKLATRPGTYQRRKMDLILTACFVLSLAAVDFLCGFSIEVYPFGYVPCLIFVGMITFAKLRYGMTFYSPGMDSGDILSAMGEALFVLDESGMVMLANASAGRLLGENAAQLHGRALGELLPGADFSSVVSLSRECGTDGARELRMAGPGGTIVHLSLSACLVAENRNGPPRAIVTVMDVTARKKAEEELRALHAGLEATVAERTRELTQANRQLIDEFARRRRFENELAESENKYRRLFDHAPDAVLLFSVRSGDPAGLAAANRAALDMFGIGPQENGTLAFADFAHDEFSLAFAKSARKLARGEWVKGESLGKRRDGGVFPMEFRAGMTAISGSDYVLIFARDITELRASEEKIKHLAFHDALTGLPNRALFYDRLSHALAFAQRHGENLAVIFMDLDRFKHVNDSLGHAEGDNLLIEAAKRLTRCLRDEDTVARLGGDEFIVLVRDVGDPERAGLTAQRLLAALCEPFVLRGQEFYVTASIGVTLFPEDGLDLERLIKNADLAMYRAKDSGGNDYRLYSPNMNARIMARLTMESRLRKALERDEFVIHYQPIVDIGSGRAAAVEALIRWRRDDILIAPAQFIPLAEESGLILSIGEYVLRRACKDIARLRENGLDGLKVAVNLSAKQFLQRNLHETVGEALRFSNLPPQSLELEITESTVMAEIDRGGLMLERLREMGVGIALDDFGTGYSSLSYLKRLVLSTLKIDRSFIRDIPHDESGMSIAQTVIALARSLGLFVVAEGVESKAQLDFLRAQGCGFAQGYYLGRPVPYGELSRLTRIDASIEGGFEDGAAAG